jgi:hypothetical protein
MHSKRSLRLMLAGLAILLVAAAGFSASTTVPAPIISPVVAAVIPPVPAPTVAPALPQKTGPSATVTFAGSTPFKTQSKSGLFRLTGIHPGEVVDIKLQFAVEWATTNVVIQALDGGNVSAQTKDSLVSADGSASFRFQAGNQPGLYRVSAIGGGGSSILKFWVADPKNPKGSPPVLNPGH